MKASEQFKARSEDSAAAWVSRDGHAVLVVADGLGSKSRAADASVLAVDLAGTQLRTLELPTDAPCEALSELVAAFKRIRAAFLSHVDREADGNEWKTTLALAVAVATDMVLTVSVGDSFLAVADDNVPHHEGDGRLHLLLPPDRMSGSPTGTHTLHSPESVIESSVYWHAGFSGVFLSSDGLENFIYPDAEGRLSVDQMMRTTVNFLAHGRVKEVDVMLENPQLRLSKGDDIGVALAAWCPP